MSSSLDVYAPCPCGSGKKLKFCCQAIVGDMEKIRRQVDAKQNRNALQSLTALEPKAPGNAWLLSTLAQVQMSEGDFAAARATLERLLAAHPDNSGGTVLHALAVFLMDGYDASLPAIQRALTRAANAPGLAAILVEQVSQTQLNRGKYLSARQYFALLLRWVAPDVRNEVVTKLLQLESDRAVFYPLRSAHYLSDWTGTDDENRACAKATRLAMLGSWDAASIHFRSLAEAHPASAALWRNTAFCRAFVGDEADAAVGFRRAAESTADFEESVELETLSQLLSHAESPDRVHLRLKTFTTTSVSRLLTKMSEAPRLARDHSTNDEEAIDDAGRPFAAAFDILDRPLPPIEDRDGLTHATLPIRVGTVMVFDGLPEKEIPPRVELTSSDIDFEAAETVLVESAGDDVRGVGPSKAVGAGFSREFAKLDRHFWIPSEGMAVASRRRVSEERWKWLIHDCWANAPQRGLGNKSPRQAAGDASLARSLRAAIAVLDAWTQQRGHNLDVPTLCRELQTAPPEPIRAATDTEVKTLSAMQLVRLAPDSLTDEQLVAAVNRAMLLGHQKLLYAVLQEVVSRAQLHAKINMDVIYDNLVKITSTTHRRAESLRYVEQAQEYARRLPNAFERLMHWELAELTIRADEPNDPAIPALLRRLIQYYGKKVPQIISTVEELCAFAGIDIPPELTQQTGGSPPADASSTTPGGIWAPGSAAWGGQQGSGGQSAPGGQKKIWTPGGE